MVHVEVGSTRRLCGVSSLASAPPQPNFPMEDKSHNLHDPIHRPPSVEILNSSVAWLDLNCETTARKD